MVCTCSYGPALCFSYLTRLLLHNIIMILMLDIMHIMTIIIINNNNSYPKQYLQTDPLRAHKLVHVLLDTEIDWEKATVIVKELTD